MLAVYFPIFVLLIFSIMLACGLLLFGRWLNRRRANAAKLSPYECGFDAEGDARMPFDVRFYLVAILFIVFDLETAFLFPWALVFRHLGWLGLVSMALFLGLLVVGFIYEWKKGALEWE